jgi:DNA polymerase-1
MEKILLVDGNNLVFRSYFATAYNGNLMRNSKGFPTNALFGFTNMINKIIQEEKPTYMIVAFDKGKTFRHEKYKEYKAGRNATPDELKMQIPLCKELLTYMGIKYYECDNYEADDILGTFARFCNDTRDFIGTIISSDRDLLQLISSDVDMKLLKQKDYIRYNKETFFSDYGILPDKVIDLKALMGDASDNIPGVAGIGEKTALKLLHDYGSLKGVYDNLDKLTLKMREKLENGKENAFMSYELATIYTSVPMEINIDDTKIKDKDLSSLTKLYEELEFYSFLKKDKKKEANFKDIKIIKSVDEINLTKPVSIHMEILGTNYHMSKVLGLGIYNDLESFFIPDYLIKEAYPKIKDYVEYVYDLKKTYVAFKWMNIDDFKVSFDIMIAAYLLNYNLKDDIAYLANSLGYDIPFFHQVYMEKTKVYKEPDINIIASNALIKAKFIYEINERLKEEIEKEDMHDLYYNIEHPLAYVLGDMEYNGVYVNKDTLKDMGVEMKEKIKILEDEIYELAGCEFNIQSPKQLGEILFEKLELKCSKKSKKGYSTAVEVLEKIKDEHPIVNKILSYRLVTKLYTTYVEGLSNFILEDGKVHTIYTQTLTRTGRLSSIEPNLQNIPIRNEYGKLIRKVFVPSKDSIIVSGDYSQIELRLLAHMANVNTMIEAFKNEEDIHTHTASSIFHVEEDKVDSNMRRIAKAVNFGIIYGISSYGLSENIGIKSHEAKEFIDKYLETYPGIKEYMDSTIKKAHEIGYVKTLYGRKRVIEELKDKNRLIRQTGERIALNTPIQGTSADIIKIAMVKLNEEFKKNNIKSKLIIQVHDELVIDTLKSEKEEVIKIMKDVMENVANLNVPLKIDVEYGDDWYQAK